MRRRIVAGMLVLCIGLAAGCQTTALADTVITEEDMEDSADDAQASEINWQMSQRVDVESCKQGAYVTLTVSLTGDTQSIQLSTIFASLQYDSGVFEISTENITPVNPDLVDYISLDDNTGELDIYYADDVSYKSGQELLKIRLRALSDADTGATEVGVDDLEIYASDSDDYVILENRNNLMVNVTKNSSAAVLLGDVNQDKKISLADAKLIMKHCNSGTKLSAAQKKNADVNRDGKVNLTDAKLVMKYCNGEIKAF